MAKRKVKKTTKATEKQKTPKVKSTIVKESKRVAYDRIQACVEALKLLKAAGENLFQGCRGGQSRRVTRCPTRRQKQPERGSLDIEVCLENSCSSRTYPTTTGWIISVQKII